MREVHAKVKQLARYSSGEIIALFVYGLTAGFVLSFNKWGGEVFDAGTGVDNLIYYTLISLFILFAATYVQKIVGAHSGVVPKFHFSLWSILIPLISIFITAGTVPFFMLPGFSTTENLSHMLGRNRFRKGFVDYMQIGMSGTVFLTVSGLFFSLPFLQNIFSGVNTTFFIFAALSLIPFDLVLKPIDKKCGVSNACGIFFCSRSLYIFAIIFLLLAFILSQTTLFFISLLVSVGLAFCVALLYFLYEENIFPNS